METVDLKFIIFCREVLQDALAATVVEHDANNTKVIGSLHWEYKAGENLILALYHAGVNEVYT